MSQTPRVCLGGSDRWRICVGRVVAYPACAGYRVWFFVGIAVVERRRVRLDGRYGSHCVADPYANHEFVNGWLPGGSTTYEMGQYSHLSLIHISEPTRLGMISYAVFCLKK